MPEFYFGVLFLAVDGIYTAKAWVGLFTIELEIVFLEAREED